MLLLILMLVLESAKVTPRTPRDEDVPVNLHHVLCRHSRARMKVVHVLCNEQELVCVLRKFRDRCVRGVWLRIADTFATFAIPVPN